MLAENFVRYSLEPVNADTPKISIDAEKAKALIDSRGWVQNFDKDIHFIWVSNVIPHKGTIYLYFHMCPRGKYMVQGYKDVSFFKPISIKELESIL